MAVKKKRIVKEENLLNWKILFLIVATFLAYFPVTSHDFVNWDDIVYIMNNDMITAVTWINLKKILSTYFMGNYHPLILLSFLFDFHFFRFSAPGYHIHNLLLHLADVFLVYTFFFHLLKRNAPVALIVALLFALHPMHVESVAWISERKDVLYTAWFFLAMICYVFYLQRGKQYYYYLTLGFFILSTLAKAQAVILPIMLILVDYLTSRKFQWKIVLEKIPFLLLSMVFGVIAVYAQRAADFINPVKIPAWQSLFYAPYSLWVYLVKFLVPFSQSAVYEYPLTQQGGFPPYLYLSPVIFLITGIIIWKTWKKQPVVTFGVLFFVAAIFPVLQFLPVGPALVSERYTYIPYIGLSFIAASAFCEYRQKLARNRKNILDAVGVLLVLLMMILTWNRVMVWKDSIALWTDVMEKDPHCVKAYTNRAFMYNEKKDFDGALKDLSDVIKIDPDDTKKLNYYSSRAFLYKKLGKFELALTDYSTAIKKHPENPKPYLDRGILYTDQFGKYDSGVQDFKVFLKKYPGDTNGNFNLGIAYYKKNSFDSAKRYFLKSADIDPANGQVHSLLTNICYRTQDYAGAYRQGILTEKCGLKVEPSLMTFLKQHSGR